MFDAANMISTIGNPSEMHMEYAAALLSSISPPLYKLLDLPQGCAAMMVALVLDKDPNPQCSSS